MPLGWWRNALHSNILLTSFQILKFLIKKPVFTTAKSCYRSYSVTGKPVNILRQCCKGLSCQQHRFLPSELLITDDRAANQDKHL